MNMKIFLYRIVVFFVIITQPISCKTNFFSKEHHKDRYEGIKENTLRVIVRYEIPHQYTDKEITIKTPQDLLSLGEKRAFRLLDGYLLMEFSETTPDLISDIRYDIFSISKKGIIKSYHCDEENCYAVIDYDVKDLLRKFQTLKTKINKSKDGK